MLKQTELIDLEKFSQPPWNDAASILKALNEIISAGNHDSQVEWDTLLFAVGNNHAGTYYPVILAIFPSIELILREGEPCSQSAILNFLIDLSSFEPEIGYETFEAASLSALVKQKMNQLISDVECLSQGEGFVSASAKELLEIMKIAL